MTTAPQGPPLHPRLKNSLVDIRKQFFSMLNCHQRKIEEATVLQSNLSGCFSVRDDDNSRDATTRVGNGFPLRFRGPAHAQHNRAVLQLSPPPPAPVVRYSRLNAQPTQN